MRRILEGGASAAPKSTNAPGQSGAQDRARGEGSHPPASYSIGTLVPRTMWVRPVERVSSWFSVSAAARSG